MKAERASSKGNEDNDNDDHNEESDDDDVELPEIIDDLVPVKNIEALVDLEKKLEDPEVYGATVSILFFEITVLISYFFFFGKVLRQIT